MAAAVASIGVTASQAALDYRFYGDFLALFPDDAIPGVDYQAMLDDPNFPDDPVIVDLHPAAAFYFTDEATSIETSGFIEWPQDGPGATLGGDTGSDNYGGAVSGIFYPQVTGTYRFHVRSDDSSALFFNPDGPEFLDPTTATPVATETDCCDAFELSGETVSDPFDLVAGEGYAMEFLWKEGGGGDWAQLGWSLNGGNPERIPAWFLQRDIRYGASSEDGIIFDFPQEPPFALEGRAFCCVGVEFDKEGVADIQWQVDDGGGWEDISDDGNFTGTNTPGLGFANVQAAWDGWEFRAIVDGEEGDPVEFEVDIDDDEPNLVRAFGNAFPQGIILEFDEGLDPDTATDAGNYEFSPAKAIQSVEQIAPNQVLISLDAFDVAESLEITVSGVLDLAADANEIVPNPRSVQLFAGGLAYLALDDNANDLLGNYDGTEMNGVSYVNDSDRGSVADFDGDDAYITFGSPNDGFDPLNDTNLWSMAVWFNRSEDRFEDATNHAVHNLLFANSANSSNDSFEIGTIGASIDAYLDTTQSDSNLPDIPAGVTNDTWHHLIFVFDSAAENETKIYFDGELLFESTQWGGNMDVAPATEWTIGLARPDQQLWGDFHGKIDDFALYSIALTPEHAAALASGDANPINVLAAGYGQLSFVAEPEDTTIVENNVVTFTAEVEGSAAENIVYRWFEDGEVLPGETSATLSFEADLGDNGKTYSVTAGNDNGSFEHISSAVVTLTVEADVTAPSIASATAVGGGGTVVVNFDEPVNAADAETLANYAVSGRTVSGASLSADGTTVTLSVGLIDFSEGLSVTASNIQDLASTPNTLASAEAPIDIQSGLINYLPLDVDASDLSGANDGTVVNGVTFIDDPERGAVASFDGNDAYITLGSPNSGFDALLDVPVFSLSVWFNRNEDRSDDNTNHTVANVILSNSANCCNDDFEIGSVGDSLDGYLDTNGRDANLPDTPAGIQDNSWHHLGVVYDANEATEFRVWVDGELVYESDLWGGPLDGAPGTEWTIGIARPDNELWADFLGQIDDFALFSSALSAEAIAAIASGDARPSAFHDWGVPPGPAVITSQPVSQSVFENDSVTFDLGFIGTPPISVDWTINGESAEGTTGIDGSSLTFVASLAQDGAVIQASIANGEGSEVSAEATLSVTPETVAPSVVTALAKAGDINTITLVFSEGLDLASAGNAGNYAIDGLTVTSATLESDGVTVTLETSQQETGASYDVVVSGVEDLAASPNATDGLSAGVTAEFNYTDAVLGAGPDGYWKLGDSDTSAAINEVNAGWNGVGNSGLGGVTPQPAERIVVGSPDGAVYFDPVQGSRFRLPDNAALNNGGPYTGARVFEFWFQADALPDAGQYAVLFESGGITRGESIYLFDGQLFMHAWNDNADGDGAPWGGPESEDKEPIFVSTEVEAGAVYHAVMVMEFSDTSEGTLYGYLNGEEFGTADGVGLLYNHGDDAGVGAIQQNTVYVEDNAQVGFGAPFNGVIDELAVYNTRLSAERIAFHYDIGSTPVDGGSTGGDASIDAVAFDGANLTIEYTGTLQSAPTVLGPFEDVAGASSPYSTPTDAASAFYRARN